MGQSQILSSWRLRALAMTALASTATALYVVPGSDCAALCLGGNNTDTATDASIGTSDIVCRDEDFSGEATGIKFRNCIECLRNSEEQDGDDSDVRWMLYNMRFALDTCLYDMDFQVHSPCIIRSGCEPLQTSIATGLETPGEQTFDYCTADNDMFFSRSHWGCVSCLHASGVQTYLSNFLQTLKAGCEQKPDPGDPIIMRGQIFSDELLNITVHNITLPGEGGASSSDITTGTIVGIAVGGALFLIGLAALIWAYCRRKKKRQAAEAADQTPSPDLSNASSFTANNHSPYINEKGHPSYELAEQRNYASNADYYDRLEEEVRAGRLDPRVLPPRPSSYNSRLASNRNTPSPSHNRTATPDEHTLQGPYLNAANNQRSSYHSHHSATPPRASYENATTGVAVATTMMSYPPPPPGPPPAHSRSGSTHSGTPSISVPSVPRVKVPKQYEPPTIVVDAASPLDDENGTKGPYTLTAREIDPRR